MDIRVFDSLSGALGAVFGEGTSIRGMNSVHGGDINDALCLTLSNDERVFLKLNAMDRLNMFVSEAHSLMALKKTGCIKVPGVLCAGTDTGRDAAFLMLEYLDSAPRKKDYWEELGQGMAMLHKADTKDFTPGGKYGFYQDNFIGITPQDNSPSDSWAEFFRDKRLAPQVEMAKLQLDYDFRKPLKALMENIDKYISEPEFPSLLHGDLWGGNIYSGPGGEPYIIDPASYVGCGQADIAMTMLFGGFSKTFYEAYGEIIPLGEEFENTKHIYNIYHILNHINMFGSSYLSNLRKMLEVVKL